MDNKNWSCPSHADKRNLSKKIKRKSSSFHTLRPAEMIFCIYYPDLWSMDNTDWACCFNTDASSLQQIGFILPQEQLGWLAPPMPHPSPWLSVFLWDYEMTDKFPVNCDEKNFHCPPKWLIKKFFKKPASRTTAFHYLVKENALGTHSLGPLTVVSSHRSHHIFSS